ncbi:Uncharacterised protein [Yersinia frederiksenii]|nr:Uncharacterised protein [Yersinia frederiksenii]
MGFSTHSCRIFPVFFNLSKVIKFPLRMSIGACFYINFNENNISMVVLLVYIKIEGKNRADWIDIDLQ